MDYNRKDYLDFDVIDLTEEDFKNLTVVQMKLLRTAQQKKDELYRNMEKDYRMYKNLAMTTGMNRSTLISEKFTELYNEYEYKLEILADNLLYNLSLNEPTNDGDLGDVGGDESAGYIVDYSLSYNERYIIVRDFYLAIPDPNERMALYAADEVAKKYLGSYYGTLYNVLATYSK